MTILISCSKSNDKELEELKLKVVDLETKSISLQVQLDLLSQKVDKPDVKTKENKVEPAKLDVSLLKKVIHNCVQTVKQLAPENATEFNNVYSTFDAYYNEASGRVLNNNKYVSQDAVYAFNKCMNDQGFSLK